MNLQMRLTPIEIGRLAKNQNLSNQAIADTFNLSKSTIKNYKRIVNNLDIEVQNSINKTKYVYQTTGLLTLCKENKEIQIAVANELVKEKYDRIENCINKIIGVKKPNVEEILKATLTDFNDSKISWPSIWYPDKKIENTRHIVENEIQLGTYSRDLGSLNRNTRISVFHQSIALILIRLLTRNYDKENKIHTFDKFSIVDPCCGMGIRVITALMMGHKAFGFDISGDTISKIKSIYPQYKDNFIVFDSVNHKLPYDDNSIDLVFTSPPYWNIEKYEEVEGQLSSLKSYEEFIESYEKLIKESIRISNKYIVFVVANFRVRGGYIPLCFDTERLFNNYEMRLWDKIILGHDISNPTGGTKSLINNHTRSAHEEMLIFKK